jgi:sulfane dehydrogenase subunit SoxC
MSDPDLLADYDPKTRAQIEAMIEAERRALARRRGELEDCDCKTGMFPDPGRRSVLFAAGSALAAGMASLLTPARAAERKAPPGAVLRDVPDDPTKVPGTPIAEDGGYGSRSQFETEVRWRFPTATTISSWTMSPLDKSEGIITNILPKGTALDAKSLPAVAMPNRDGFVPDPRPEIELYR